jgi:hypothetical protein
MSGLYVKDDDTWYLPKSVWVKSGTWRVCNNVYVKSGGAWKELIKTIDINSSKSNFNLYEYLGSPSEPLSVIVNIASFVEIFSSNTSGNRTTAFTVGNFPTGSTVIINNNGYISGGGGFGGTPEYRYGNGYYLPSNGTNGGDGLVKGSSNNFDCTIVNTGTIAGGGGGGAGGQIRYVCPPQPPNIYDDGCRNVNGNTGGQGAGITGASRTQGGSPMTFNPNPYDTNPPTPNTDTGGFGGALGEAGQGNGQTGSKARTGGAGGKAIGSGIEIAVSGTIIGAVG